MSRSGGNTTLTHRLAHGETSKLLLHERAPPWRSELRTARAASCWVQRSPKTSSAKRTIVYRISRAWHWTESPAGSRAYGFPSRRQGFRDLVDGWTDWTDDRPGVRSGIRPLRLGTSGPRHGRHPPRLTQVATHPVNHSDSSRGRLCVDGLLRDDDRQATGHQPAAKTLRRQVAPRAPTDPVASVVWPARASRSECAARSPPLARDRAWTTASPFVIPAAARCRSAYPVAPPQSLSPLAAPRAWT